MSLKIDSEFKNLIPPLAKEEYQQLEENLVKEGCIDALITWNGTLIDGHNRYEICTRRKIQFGTKEHQFGSRDEVKEWIILHQFGRRNISINQRSLLALKLDDVVKAKAKEKLKTSTGGKNPQPLAPAPKAEIHTDIELSKTAGVSPKTIQYARVIMKEGTEEQQERFKNDKAKAKTLYKEIRKPKEEKKVETHKPDKLETKAKEVNKNKDIEELERLYEECKTIEPVNEINNNSTIIITEIRRIVNDSVHGLRIQIDNVKALDSESKQAINQILEPIKNVLKDYEKIILEVTKNDK